MRIALSVPALHLASRRVVALTALACWCWTAAQAQMGPGSGPPGAGGGGHNGSRNPSRAAAPAEQRAPALEDLMPPDPWHIWGERLALDSATLALTPAQQPAFDAFVRELDLAAQFNSARLMRAMRHRPSAVSANPDVARDLRLEADDAQDWLATLADLRRSWDTLLAGLTPAQQSSLQASYRASLDAARQAPALARAGAARPTTAQR